MEGQVSHTILKLPRRIFVQKLLRSVHARRGVVRNTRWQSSQEGPKPWTVKKRDGSFFAEIA